MRTYQDYQNDAASEKLALVRLEAAKRLVGWVRNLAGYYTISFSNSSVISAIEESGTAYSAVSDPSLITPGTYSFDRSSGILSLCTLHSENPNGCFIACRFPLFFANAPIHAPWDLATGFDVEWIPYLLSTSDFGVEMDQQNQMAMAIEGSGNIQLANDRSYWAPIFDKLTFENQRCLIYSYNRNLPITEAKLLYRGRVQGKTWATDRITFQLADVFQELRAKIDLPLLSEIPSPHIPESLVQARARRLYGYVQGFRPTNVNQVLGGWPLFGTLSASNGSVTVTGASTSFTARLSPDDELLLGDDTQSVTIQSIESDTSLTLSEPYTGTDKASVFATFKPANPNRFINRRFSIASHALCEPKTTVTAGITPSVLDLASTQDLRVGDPLIISGELAEIWRISRNRVKLTTNLSTIPNTGVQVLRPSVSNVYLNEKLLQPLRDYTYNPDTGEMNLDPLCEFNIAPVRWLGGALSPTVSFTTGSKAVTGTNTQFTSFLKSGDWIAVQGQADFFEILQITDDLNLTLRTAATYTASGQAKYKSPEVYEEGSSVLSIDCLGATDDGTSNGALLKTAPQIVRDLLKLAGVSAPIDEQSFITAQALLPQTLGLAIPKAFGDKNTPSYRDTINEINRSAFGSLIQDEDFTLAYTVLNPKRPEETLEFAEADIQKLKVDSKSDKIVKTVKVNYCFREYEPFSQDKVNLTALAESARAQYLAQTSNEFSIDTLLTEDPDAQVFANRWAFILEVASSTIQIQTGLKGSRLQVNDKIIISHDKLYERIGSSDKRKYAAVQYAKKSMNKSTIEIEDLANSFSRCAIISGNAAQAYADAGAPERAQQGFITDSYGMIANDPDTHGVNLIW